MDTTTPRYGLARGREWVCCSRASLRYARSRSHQREPMWLPGLKLGPPDKAWTTGSLEVALERQVILRGLTSGWATTVQRVS